MDPKERIQKESKVKSFYRDWKPRSIFTYILVPTLLSALLISLLAIHFTGPSITSYFVGVAREDLDLASELAYAECEEQFKDLLSLRLSDNPLMVAAMRQAAQNAVLMVAKRFNNIQMLLVDQNGSVITGTSALFVSGLKIPLPERGDEDIHVSRVLGREVSLQARYFPFWRWYVVSLITNEDIHRPVRHILSAVVISLSFVLCLLIVAVLITLHLAVKRPLNTLIEALSEISEGRFRRVENTRRDELGRITEAVNSMSESLELQQQALEVSLREKSVLLQEIHHRVKNNLNVVISLLNLQSDQIESAEDAKKALSNSCNRIYAMALVHEKLYRSDSLSEVDLKSYVDSITGHLLTIYGRGKEIELDLRVEDVNLDISTAMPCGLIINELCTNSLLHAFEGRNRGKISLCFRENRGDEAFWELEYRDDGIGLTEFPNISGAPKTLGMLLINVLSEQLSGKMEFCKGGGFCFLLKIPRRN